MENLNKYWFSHLLIAVIFGLLGFLLGRQGHPPKPNKACAAQCSKMMQWHHQGATSEKSEMIFIPDGAAVESIENIDVKKIKGNKGEQKVQVRIKTKED